MRKLLVLLVFMLGLASGAALAQGVRYDSVAFGPRGPIPNPIITVCSATATGLPCSSSVTTYTDQTLSSACSPGTQVVLTGTSTCVATGDALGNFGFWLAPGMYKYTITAPSITGQIYTLTVPVGANTSGAAIIPLLNCKNIESSIFCVDTTNTQGWAGADAGAWINSAIAAMPSTGGKILIATGVYNYTTPIVSQSDVTLECPAGPSTTTGRATLKYTPTTGIAISALNSSFHMYGCNLTTSTSTTSVGMQWAHIAQSSLDQVHINGFKGGLRVTGDGASTFSVGVRITNSLIDGIDALCAGGGEGYGVYFDHAIDIYWDKNEIYSVNNCATGKPMIIDTGASGIWLSGSTFEQGLNAGIIRHLNNAAAGGAYGGVPGAIWATGISWDFSPGGDALLFDSTLGSSDIKFFCTACWLAGGGRTNINTIITTTANGLNIQGGSDIHFKGGISRVNALWGVVINTTGQNIDIEGMNIHANNQQNTAGVGGIQVTANPIGYRLIGNRSGNILESGGNQAYGIDISLAGTNGVISSNDLRNNNTARLKLPAGFGPAAVDAPEFGSLTGMQVLGPLHMPEGTAPSGAGAEAVCYADSAVHALKCSYNNGSFFNQTQTIFSSTAVMTTALIASLACGATVTVAATGVAATDAIIWAFNAAPAANPGELVVSAWPTANNVNFQYCNPTAGGVTPNAATLNWRVVR